MDDDVQSASWLLLLHQIPAKPDYLRVKIWRRMQRLGAVALKNAAWVLPAGESAREDFEWLKREIEAEGGEAILCDARFISGLSFEQATALEPLIMRARVDAAAGSPIQADGIERGRVWVTRKNVFIDRIASAWLIRRRIDPGAQFKFVDSDYQPNEGEVRFDMYGGEFTHVGDACTFEVLASTFAPADLAIARIAQVVHDIDMKDMRYGHAETAGVAFALTGLCATIAADDERLVRGAEMFDWFYASLRAQQTRMPPSSLHL